MAAITQSGRLLQFSCSGLAPDALLIQSVHGVESISQLFQFTVELLLPQDGDPVTPDSLIGKNATVTIQPLGTDQPRWINGLISSVEQNWTFSEFDVFTVQLVPALWQASLSVDCRCLQNMKPMEVIKKVLDPYSLSLRDKTTGSSPDGKPFTASDYTTQYNESDFDFISRVAEQHGIFYWFDHSESGKHILTFGNSRDGYGTDSFPVSFVSGQGSHELMYRPMVSDFRLTDSMVAGQHSRRDYDWRNHKPFVVSTLTSTKPGPGGKNAFEHYNFPSAGSPQFKALGKQLQPTAGADAGVEAHRNTADVASKMYHGASNSRALYPACTLDLDHPRDDWAQKYLLTQVTHEAEQAPPYQSDGSGKDGGYENRFAGLEATRNYAPPLLTARPRIAGMQSAVVVTPAGEDLSVDKNGRVCVQFLWNREAKPHTLDNTWLRVAQQWAGSGWGTYFWPRTGDEVLVSFFNGDPDDPIIMGSAYNGVNVPKYNPADHSTRSGILTRSSLTGTAANANEMWFEDKMGAEQIVMHAERDFNTSVEVNNTRTVGANESITVSADRSVHVVKNQTVNIDESHTHFIDGTSDFTLGGTLKVHHKSDSNMTYDGRLNEKIVGDHSVHSVSGFEQKVGSIYNIEAGSEVHMKAGTELVIESGVGLHLKVGGNHITINPSGITIFGTMVYINSAPAPMVGMPVVVADPELPNPKVPPSKDVPSGAPANALAAVDGGAGLTPEGLRKTTGRHHHHAKHRKAPPGAHLSHIAKNVNPSNSVLNCGNIVDADIARLSGKNPSAVAPDKQDGTFDQIEQRHNTKLTWHKSFQEAFTDVRKGGNGTTAIVGIVYPNAAASHVVVMSNDQGAVGIIEGQDWGAGNPKEVITSAAEANARYNATGGSNIGYGLVPKFHP